LSGKKQDHTNSYYLSQFAETYTTESVNTILKTLQVLVNYDEIYGFGIYFKSGKTEFSIVLKLKKRPGTNWIHIVYLLETRGWVNIIKKGDLGPKELYQAMNARGLYAFTTTKPSEFSKGQPISEMNSYFSGSHDVEYNLSQFEKYGGNNRLTRQNSKKIKETIPYYEKNFKKKF
jgi:hypothetical protein